MSLPRAVQKGQWHEVEAALKEFSKKSDVHDLLMSKNTECGTGLLMLAASTGKEGILHRLAGEIQDQLGTALLVKQLRDVDDEQKPLLFHAVSGKSTPSSFRAARVLLSKTLGRGGMEGQLKQLDSSGRNIFMHAARCGRNMVWLELWSIFYARNELEGQLAAVDKDGKRVLMYAAEAGNEALVKKILDWEREQGDARDLQGWNVFMYAARGRRSEKVLQVLHDWYSYQALLEHQLTMEGFDGTTVLMHAALGGFQSFSTVRKFLSNEETGFAKHSASDLERLPLEAKLLGWAAKGGDASVLNTVAAGIKAQEFKEGVMTEVGWFKKAATKWYTTSAKEPGEAKRLKAAIGECSSKSGSSLFMSAIESGKEDMIKAVMKGIRELFPDEFEVRWPTLCGLPGDTPEEDEGNPLSLAATSSVGVFKAALKALEEECASAGNAGIAKLQEKLMPTQRKETPLHRVVCGHNIDLFDEVLAAIQKHFPEGQPTGRQIMEQVGTALNADQGDGGEQWISAIMLPKVLKAARDADRFGGGLTTTPYDIALLDGAVKMAVARDAFEHLRTLIQNGCHIVKQFPSLLKKIGVNESTISEFIVLAITAARNPFVVCSVALQDIRQLNATYPVHKEALKRLQRQVIELALELLRHLPQSVYGVGAELARGDPDLTSYVNNGMDKPSELLGFVAVRWMLGRGIERKGNDEGGEIEARESLILHAVNSGTAFLDLLSAPLLVDYLRLEFTRTLPSWNSSDPFERNINQAFYSYTSQDRDQRSRATGCWQGLLAWLQGWSTEGSSPFTHTTVLPGLQFILAGLMGKPGAFYPVPAVRMMFNVMGYIAMMGLYLSSVELKTERIPAHEWTFYVFMAGILWREGLEFVRAKKSVRSSPSVERYFSDPWNFLDVSTLIVVGAAFALRVSGDQFRAQLCLAASAPLLFSRVLFLSQIGSTLGPMTQVIFKMLSELAQFSVIFLVVMMGFATCFTALYGRSSVLLEKYGANLASTSGSCEVDEHPIYTAFGDFGEALLTLFEAMLGEYDFTVFAKYYTNDAGDQCDEVPYRSAGVALLVVYLVIMAVMLLNLLIAVLSTAHSNVYQDADKQFHLARAKLILQSRDDVLNDVLPPPFNIIKPVLGLLWPARCLGESMWEITMLAVHRFIFSVCVGLPAVAVSSVLWGVSLPWVTWSITRWLVAYSKRAKRTTSSPQSVVPDGEADTEEVDVRAGNTVGVSEPELQHESSQEAIERVFFDQADGQRLTWPHICTFVGGLFCVMVALATASLLCFVVYPLLSLLLWGRGLCGLWKYVKQSYNTTPWARRQIGLGEDGEEWSVARSHAIKRNKSYRHVRELSEIFNVSVLLTATTGMTMEDLRQGMSTEHGPHEGAYVRHG